MSDENQFVSSGDDGEAAVTISSTVMVAAVIFLSVVIVFVFLLYLYAKRYLGPTLARRGSRARFVFAAVDPFPGRGLDATALQTLPVAVYKKADFKEGLECAVCLSELADGEEVRLLPKCNHGFHVECIDLWFQSHSTCPLCRSPVGLQPSPPENPNSGEELTQVPPSEAVAERPAFPTNILFWGSQDQVNARNLTTAPAVAAGDGSQGGASGSSDSSSSRKPGGALVIEIPSRMPEEVPSPMSPLPPSRLAGEEMKSPASSRFRSLTRLLSRGKRAIGSSYSPRVADIEQGSEGYGGTMAEGSVRTPKTPTCL